jgi:nucleosome binding factor SPN SPT16 subunit
VDTVRVDQDKAIPLTEGVKSTKDTLFFLSPSSDGEIKQPKEAKAASSKRPTNGTVSPVKSKTVAGKVLRNKTRSAAQEEVQTTAVAILVEHQKELHARLQAEGLAKHSEGDGGNGGKEGKGWKRFQSYKGEGALPKEVESMRVRLLAPKPGYVSFTASNRYTSIGRL